MNQQPKHTEVSPNSYDAAAYGYDYRYDGFGGSAWASQSANTSRTLTSQGNNFDYTSTTFSTGFGARYYESDLSIWLSVDPLADKYPSMSPYMYTAGNPVMLVDHDGRFFLSRLIRTTYKALTNWFKNDLKSYVNNNEMLKNALMEVGGCVNEKQLTDILTYNQKGFEIMEGGSYNEPSQPFGEYQASSSSDVPDRIVIDNAILDLANQILSDKNSTKLDIDAVILMVFSTYLHESVHYLRDKNNKTKDVGSFEYDDDLGGDASLDAGKFFEMKVWGKVFKAGSISIMKIENGEDSRKRAKLVFEEAKQYLKHKQENNDGN